MKIPKCPATVTGKHKFTLKRWTLKNMSLRSLCDYCGMLDDRKV